MRIRLYDQSDIAKDNIMQLVKNKINLSDLFFSSFRKKDIEIT
jgi:hypothetical protein